MQTRKPQIARLLITAALSSTVVATASAGSPQQAFSFKPLSHGYQLAQADMADHKTGEGKCGEGKCGGDKDSSGTKHQEGKCGGNEKAGEGKCGGKEKAGEGKCGEGKCGGDKKSSAGG